MWNMPTHEEEPWERDRRRLGDAEARTIWEGRRKEMGVSWASRRSERPADEARAVPMTAAQRLVTIALVGTALVILLVLAELWLRSEGTTGLRGPNRPTRTYRQYAVSSCVNPDVYITCIIERR
jgi:hypothetical protein